ncbi:uncharacterized protein PV07_02990 [Cladophialophora immunda]|uniref:Extracellular membrane protein CFEM domain-containing protein n=1 Tax=Cladophialophora immunda TaxID=569365 RepID=A0A0D2CJK4_9EURO|nr:uncharacterized protein PV07_02990 [Cladophialophora immunda]KIW31333.1 hypothetical protein PV07_02990 [Cladophialophora immunda]OQV06234.1 hypothetical protein CLAIMM_10836 [Cladophialophora immunda]
MSGSLRVYALFAILYIFTDLTYAGSESSQRQPINNTQPIDVSKIPSCLLASCDTDPLGTAPKDACTPLKPSTQLYNRSCYCSLKDPLYCAWSFCTWWDWMATEDWFVKECGPGSDDLSYDGLPACAQGCLRQKLVYYGCITEGRNCFCIHGSLFDCQSNCHKESEITAIKDWLTDQCGVSAALAQKGVDTGVFYGSTDDTSESRQSPLIYRPKRKKLKWYEIFAIVLLCLSFVMGGIIWIASARKRNAGSAKKRQKSS